MQHVINRARFGVPALREDDRIGPLTIGRIREYQAKVLDFPHPDGVVDPGGRTLRSLLERIAMQRRGAPAPASKPAVRNAASTTAPAPALVAARPVGVGAGAARHADRAVGAALPGAIRAQAATPRVGMPSGASGNKLTEQDFVDAAASLGPGVDAALVHAVAYVESSGKSGFNAAGLPVIAFEGHRFRRLTKGIYDRTHPMLSYPYVTNAGWQWQKNNAGQVNAWATLNKALVLNHDAALLSCSWGMFQVMATITPSAGTPTSTRSSPR